MFVHTYLYAFVQMHVSLLTKFGNKKRGPFNCLNFHSYEPIILKLFCSLIVCFQCFLKSQFTSHFCFPEVHLTNVICFQAMNQLDPRV